MCWSATWATRCSASDSAPRPSCSAVDRRRCPVKDAGREGAGERGLVLVRGRPRQLKAGPARREARVPESEIDEEALALLAGDVTGTWREDRHLHRWGGLLRGTPVGSRSCGRHDDSRERDKDEGGEHGSLMHWKSP